MKAWPSGATLQEQLSGNSVGLPENRILHSKHRTAPSEAEFCSNAEEEKELEEEETSYLLSVIPKVITTASRLTTHTKMGPVFIKHIGPTLSRSEFDPRSKC